VSAAVVEEVRATEAVDGGAVGQVALVDLLDRLLGAGVVLAGDVVISLAGVDLGQVRLPALVTTIRADMVAPP
jgi:hypothetical protein